MQRLRHRPAPVGAAPLPPARSRIAERHRPQAARDAERELIYRTLQQTRWNRREAAEILGVSYKALLYKIKEAELDKAVTRTDDSFSDEEHRMLSPDAFEFVLNNELKRAVRSQNFLTLVHVETCREWEGMMVTADDGTLEEVGRLIRRRSATPTCWVIPTRARSGWSCSTPTSISPRASSSAWSPGSGYQFPTALRIAIGAACYPTHAIVADSLKREALSRPLVNWRGGVLPSPDEN